MAVRVFVDTNVLIYSRDGSDPAKAIQSTEWLKILRQADGLVLSPQVLNEAYSVSLSRFGHTGTRTISDWIGRLSDYCSAPLDARTVRLALEIHRQHQLSWWDCPIVASALLSGCAYLLSEDMQHQQLIRTVRVINPFQTAPSDISISN